QPSGDLQADVKSVFELLTKIVVDMTSINFKISNGEHRLDSIDKRFVEVESRVSTLEDHMVTASEKMTDLEKKLYCTWECIEDLENHLRQNNVCILGIPKRAEEGKTMDFLLKLLPKVLELPPDDGLDIKRAHRSLAPRPQSNQRPRPIIIRLLKYEMRELILRRAREMKEIIWEGNKLSFYQDLSKEVQMKRKSFWEVKKKLRDLSFHYTMAYPVILRIHYEGQTKSFPDLEAAKDFIQTSLSKVPKQQEGAESSL
uniref:L1 transposable element RRM domain-containing protein n=1 Tax=Latimeria chalumnae TaxID=7897 RepID=H2ZVL1_LATCH